MATMNPVERAEAELAEIEKLRNPGEQKPPTEEVEQAQEEPEAQEEEEDQQQEAARVEEDDYKQKWLSLQGMYRKSKEQVDSLISQNRQLTEKIDRFMAEPKGKGETLAPDASTKEITDHLRSLSDEYGEDFTNALSSVVKQMVGSELKSVTGDLAKVREQVNTVQKDTVEDRQTAFKQGLTQRCPDWFSIFQSDQFAGWLDSNVEALSGRTYGDLFEQANNDWDMDRMVRFFESYKKNNGKVVEERPDPRKQHVVPGRSKASAPPTKKVDRQWDGNSINKFYDDVRRGIYNGKEAEMQAIEEEIFAANAGR